VDVTGMSGGSRDQLYLSLIDMFRIEINEKIDKQTTKDAEAAASKNRRLTRSLKEAAREGSLPKIMDLVEAGADVNGVGGMGQPPLTNLVFRFFDNSASSDLLNESFECIEFMLNSGANPNAGDPSSFELSVELGNRKILTLMLKHGADLNKKANMLGGMLPLHIALSNADDNCTFDSGCAIDLINAGADLSAPDDLGNLPIHLASKNGYSDVLIDLLRVGPEHINKINSDGRTPLIVAAESGQDNVIQLLLSFGAESPDNLKEILVGGLKNKEDLIKSALEENLEILDIGTDDAAYLRWSQSLGFDQDVQTPNLEPVNDENYVSSVRGQIDNWFDEFYVPIIDEVWDKYVPKSGFCNVLQGELGRCIGRLEGELFKNGMVNMGDGYYDHMVDKIKETVLRGGDFSPLVQKVLEMDALIVKGADYSEVVNTFSIFHPTDVEMSLNRMKMVVAAWCKARPEPIAFNPSVLN